MATRKRIMRRDTERHSPSSHPNPRSLPQFNREVVVLMRSSHKIPSETSVRLIGRNSDWVKHAWRNKKPPCYVADELARGHRGVGLSRRDPEHPREGEVYQSRAGAQWKVVSVNGQKKRIKVRKVGFKDVGELEWNPSVLKDMKQLQGKIAAQIRHDEGPPERSELPARGLMGRLFGGSSTNDNERDMDGPRRRYYVYVIESRRGPLRILYVGHSAHKPQKRLTQHKQGKAYCVGCTKRSYAKGERLRLVPEFYKNIPTIKTRQHAEKVERILARKLRSLGFNVEGGH